MNRAQREQRKAELLGLIQQQRLDLNAARRDWLLSTTHYDHVWLTIMSVRRYLLIGSSALAIWSVRNPNIFIRWAKRGIGIWSTWRLLRRSRFFR